MYNKLLRSFFLKKKFKFAPDDSYKIKINMYIKLWKYLLILAHGIHNNNNSKFNNEDGEISEDLSRFFLKSLYLLNNFNTVSQYLFNRNYRDRKRKY